jgi:membrane protease YdiL (CAAX protease family)
MKSVIEHLKLIYFDLLSGFQFSFKKMEDIPSPIEVIKILIIWATISIPLILVFSFFLGFIKLPLKPSEFLFLDILILILILFKILLKKGYSLRKVFKLELLRFRLLFPIILIGIGLSIINGELEYLVRHTIELFFDANIIPIGESKILLEMNQWSYFLYVVISAPILEELIFRGAILTSIENSNGVIKAIIYSSLAFAITHIYLTNVFSIFITSLVTAIIVLSTNSVISGIVIHVINNLIYFYSARLRNSTEISAIFSLGIDSAYLQSFLTLILSLILLILGLIWFKKILNSMRTKYRNEIADSGQKL